MVHALRPESSEVVVKLGGTRLNPTSWTRHPCMCGPWETRSRVGTHRSGGTISKGHFVQGLNIQEFSVGDTSTLHHNLHVWYSYMLFCTDACGIFSSNPAGHTAERKTRRKRNLGCYELLSVPCHPSSPPSHFSPPHTAHLSHRLRPRYQD